MPQDVAGAEPGRIARVRVDVGSAVHAGDAIVELETTAIDAEISTARAEREVMIAAVEAERERGSRRAQDDIASLEQDLQRENEAIARAQSTKVALVAERDRVTRLVADKQAVVGQLSPLVLEEAGLDPIVKSRPAAASLLRERIDTLTQRKDNGPAVVDDLEAKVDLAEQRIRALESRKVALVIRAPVDGVVSDVLKHAGDFVAQGVSIVRVVPPPRRVVACEVDDSLRGVVVGSRALVRARGATGAPVAGHVTTVVPVVESLPEACRASPQVASFGRRVLIDLDEPPAFVAGQPVDVDLAPHDVIESEAIPADASTSNAPAGRSGIHVIQVPQAIAETTRFEPSGVARAPRRDDYLVVSDDTGLGDERLPMLFRMTKAGAVTEAPRIRGVDEVTDLESITVVRDTIYVLSSQSKSKRGKRPVARTAFLKLAADGDGFRVDAAVHLFELLDREPASTARALGLASLGELEIEGMAARGDELYLGLKAPLDAEGRALVWKLAHPEALFAGKPLGEAGLSLWARARLPLGTSGEVGGGVAELAFVGNDLAIASTPSSGDDARGAVFRASASGGLLEPKLVVPFDGRKPEGLALTEETPRRLLVVFDAGAATPEMTEIEWPQ
jgi:multidrug resistance efflux pump